jgi:hypothetical protein
MALVHLFVFLRNSLMMTFQPKHVAFMVKNKETGFANTQE